MSLKEWSCASLLGRGGCCAAMLAGVVLMGGCDLGKPQAAGGKPGGGAPGGEKKEKDPIQVRMATVASKPMPVEFRTFGVVEPMAVVELKSQVGGVLKKEHVEPGQAVKEGDRLFQIDPDLYDVALSQAEAALVQNQVQLAEAERQAELATVLFEKKAGTEDNMKARNSAVKVCQAQVALSEALLAKAKLDLKYTDIRAPFTGRIGEIKIRQGSLVKANEGVVAILAKVSPAYVVFAVPQTRLAEVRAEMARHPLEVVARLRNQERPVATGTLSFIDNAVDIASGTIKVKAVFPNVDEALWPGQHIEVVLRLRQDDRALVVPGAAIQNGQQGTYVFVVRPDSKVEMRPVVLDRMMDDEVVIAKGLKVGETVVTDGQIRLVPEAAVAPLAPADKPAGPPAPAAP